MFSPIQTAKTIVCFFVIILISATALRPAAATGGGDAEQSQLYTDQEAVEFLVRQWAPLVWLAPGEKFMPGDVRQFLHHVHAEKPDGLELPTEDVNYFFQHEDELGAYLRETDTWERRNKRMFKDRYDVLDDLKTAVPLPHGEFSKNLFLVTDNKIDKLLDDDTSFIYGENPRGSDVPIYAVVSLCNSLKFEAAENEIKNSILPATDINNGKNYIPLYPEESGQRSKRELIAELTTPSSTIPELINEIPSKYTENKVKLELSNQLEYKNNVPHFHVTYWMFYPYSQGKTMCIWSFGPLGKMPIPLIFGMCLGTRKDFGSHVGDWEHMTLYFRGSMEPDEMYVSAHDAGAYYTYDRLTGTFEFRSQETRKGILQRPNFPRTVVTSSNHPVLFAAKGSHGLWTAPGKHKFVRVPRLYDINGFGTPWSTWNKVEISYKNERSGRSIGPDWLQYKGRWGNPKSKCHPLKRIGLNFCEYADGPTGIPRKKPHFFCT